LCAVEARQRRTLLRGWTSRRRVSSVALHRSMASYSQQARWRRSARSSAFQQSRGLRSIARTPHNSGGLPGGWLRSLAMESRAQPASALPMARQPSKDSARLISRHASRPVLMMRLGNAGGSLGSLKLNIEIGKVERRHRDRARRPVVNEYLCADAVQHVALLSAQRDLDHVHFAEGARHRAREAFGAGVYRGRAGNARDGSALRYVVAEFGELRRQLGALRDFDP
jgi:hypothetical protein